MSLNDLPPSRETINRPPDSCLSVSTNFESGSFQSMTAQSTCDDFACICDQVAPASGLTLIGSPYTRANSIRRDLPVGSNAKQPGHSVRPLIVGPCFFQVLP